MLLTAWVPSSPLVLKPFILSKKYYSNYNMSGRIIVIITGCLYMCSEVGGKEGIFIKAVPGELL